MEIRWNKDFTWIQLEDLETVFLKLLEAQQKNPEYITGTLLGFIAKRLIDIEINPGGPYLNKEKIKLNAMIFRFFKNQGIHLKKLEGYLRDQIDRSVITPDQELNDAKEYLYFSPSEKDSATKANNLIESSFENELKYYPESIQKTLTEKWKTIKKVDSRKEISMLSSYFLKSLTQPLPVSLSEVELGLANIYAWIAYTIYDSIIDNNDDIDSLPAANMAHRSSIIKYLLYSDFKFINPFFNSVDDSNAIELNNCRLKISEGKIEIPIMVATTNLAFLKQKTVGHILGPIIITKHIKKATKNQKDDVENALNHYLIARQLSDDIHDWRKDLMNGHMTYVIAFLLESCDISPGTYNLKELTKKINKFFWLRGLNQLADAVIDEVRISKELFESSRLIDTSKPFYKLLVEPIKLMAITSKDEIKDQKEFLNTFTTSF